MLSDGALLRDIAGFIEQSFGFVKSYNPTDLMIVTWSNVTYYGGSVDKVSNRVCISYLLHIHFYIHS